VTLRDDAAKISGDVAGLRHAIHRDPEIGVLADGAALCAELAMRRLAST